MASFGKNSDSETTSESDKGLTDLLKESNEVAGTAGNVGKSETAGKGDDKKNQQGPSKSTEDEGKGEGRRGASEEPKEADEVEDGFVLAGSPHALAAESVKDRAAGKEEKPSQQCGSLTSPTHLIDVPEDSADPLQGSVPISIPSPQVRESESGSLDSATSAEKDGFEVLRLRELQLLNQRDSAESKDECQAVITANEELTGNKNMNDTISNSDSPHSLQIDESNDEITSGHPQLLDPQNESASMETDEQGSSTSINSQSAPVLERVSLLDENQDPYADVAKDPLLGQRPSNEVLQLVEQQSAEERRLKEEQEQQERQVQERQRLEQVQQGQTLPAGQVPNSAGLLGAHIPFELFAAASGGQIPASALQTLQLAAARAVSGPPDSKVQPLTNPFSSSTVAAITQQLAASSASSGALTQLNTTSLQQSSEQQRITQKRREVYRWSANHQLFAMAWSYKRYDDQRLRMACSSIKDSYELLRNTFDEEKGELVERANVFIGTPSCELHFIPDPDATRPDLIASATKEMRVYSYHPEQKENKSFAYAGPLTSVDWNEVDPTLLGGSSIDSTCTIWDIEAQAAIATVPPPPFNDQQPRLKTTLRTQLIAHELPVHDMAFSRLGSGKDYFASCGADGSVRMFDLRNLKHSTILYEHPDKQKLNHISWNKCESSQFAIVAHGSNEQLIVKLSSGKCIMAKNPF